MAAKTTLQKATALCQTIDNINATAFQMLSSLIQENGNEIRLSEDNQIDYKFTDCFENEQWTEIYKVTTKGETVHLHQNSSWLNEDLHIDKTAPNKGDIPVARVLKAVVKQLTETTAK